MRAIDNRPYGGQGNQIAGPGFHARPKGCGSSHLSQARTGIQVHCRDAISGAHRLSQMLP